MQALLVFQGTRTYTFKLGVFSCNPNDDLPLPPRPPPSPLLPSGLFYISLSLGSSPLAAHVGAGLAALFTFKAAPHQTSGIFRIIVIEDNPDVTSLQRNNLRVVVRAGAPPSLATSCSECNRISVSLSVQVHPPPSQPSTLQARTSQQHSSRQHTRCRCHTPATMCGLGCSD